MAITKYDVTYEDAEGNTQVATKSVENENGDWVKASTAQAIATERDNLKEQASGGATGAQVEELKAAFGVTDTQPFNKMLAKVSEQQAHALKSIFGES